MREYKEVHGALVFSVALSENFLTLDVKSGQVQRSRDGYYPRHPGFYQFQSHLTVEFLFL
jgi:hypothetical protein